MGIIRKENPGQADKLTLPIASNRKGLKSTIGKAPIKVSVKEVEGLLLDRIKSYRDFADGGNRPLVALNDLSNWNKHNLLIATAGVTYVPDLRFGTNFVSGCEVHGGVASLVHYFPEDGELTYEGEPTVDVLFGQPGLVKDKPVIPTLLNLAEVTLESLKAFCDVFPDCQNPRFSH